MLNTCLYAKNVYYEKYNSNAKSMFVSKFKETFWKDVVTSSFLLKKEKMVWYQLKRLEKLLGVSLPYFHV